MSNAPKSFPAVVITKLPNGEVAVFGPFASGDEASNWGFRKFSGQNQEWFWESVFPVTQD